MTSYLLLLTGVMLNAAAQLLLKAGMNRIGHFEFSYANAWPIGLQAATNLPIIAGLTCYVVSVVIWMMVLSRLEVSIAYPMVSIGYVVTAIAAWHFFGENLTPMRIAGIAVIIMGVFMVSKTA